ncbi:hypothetical protein NC653_029539 [Populus alba x Populus x berolinensis]|uniref:Uncharacterized protein n=1 Tax=Populus alba x Populus x berolinensis TaxID=444605 RepID=A0AAD6M3E4_9ROSI|nr:hypothetical protein NC653_029539 [Populus alba x Populus x berolinensis]
MISEMKFWNVIQAISAATAANTASTTIRTATITSYGFKYHA